MKKNVLILILVISNVVLGAFAYKENQAARDSRLLALQNEAMALQQEHVAQENMRMALAARDEAEMQRKLAEANMRACLSRK
jgi:hypothetical protein